MRLRNEVVTATALVLGGAFIGEKHVETISGTISEVSHVGVASVSITGVGSCCDSGVRNNGMRGAGWS